MEKKSGSKKKRKKMSAEDEEDEVERSGTSSELGEPAIGRTGGSKKRRLEEESDSEEDGMVNSVEEEEENPNALVNFRISKPLVEKLKNKGIESLFPIQAMTFDIVLDGSDLVGRARTGQVLEISLLFNVLDYFLYHLWNCC